jgi:hypothetical protein
MRNSSKCNKCNKGKNLKNRNKTRKSVRRGGALTALQYQQLSPSTPGGLSAALPVTDWGRWSNFSNSHQWSPTTSAPAPLANGGLYTNPQSTGAWASSPFPATQHAFALEASKVSGLPEVAYHQRPNDNFGSSFSPVVGTHLTSNHWSASGPAGPIKGGSRKNKNRNKKSEKRTNSKRRWF